LSKGEYRYGSDYSISGIMAERTPPGCGGASPTSFMRGAHSHRAADPADVLESSIQISGKHSYPSIYRMTQKLFTPALRILGKN
jgi:hypothetical protein